MTTPSWYDVLDVEPTASTDEIRAAWRTAIADLEPGSRRFATLNQAAEVLLDERRRAAYDAERSPDATPARAPTPTPTLTPREVDRENDRLKREVSKDLSRERRREEKRAAQQAAQEARASDGTTSAAPVLPAWLLAILGVLAALSVAAAVWVWQTGDDTSVEDATSAAQSAAEQAIVPVLSYDYQELDADQKRAQSYLTPAYREDYDQLFGVITDNAPTTQTKVSAEVVASGIVRSGEGRVDVLVFVDRPTTNKLTPEPVTYRDQVTVTMEKVGDDWLVDDLVTSPAAK